MSADKYPSLFSGQMAAIVYLSRTFTRIEWPSDRYQPVTYIEDVLKTTNLSSAFFTKGIILTV